MHDSPIDKAGTTRQGQQLEVGPLTNSLRKHFGNELAVHEIWQFPGGYSNLTYLLRTNQGELVLRKAPPGVAIKGGHDMEREYRVLSALKPVFGKVPAPIFLETDPEYLGTPFYVMERLEGIILRAKPPKAMELNEAFFANLSREAIELLAKLHSLDLKANGLDQMGKPEGYIRRQVEGWIGRYYKAKTDEIRDMEAAAEWLQDRLPAVEETPYARRAAFIHNDYKYDNLLLAPEAPHGIIGVLDWEMATVGHPAMDLGTSLAYWCEEGDHPALKAFNTTWMPGNLDREGVIRHYESVTGTNVSDPLFYYVFGCFKVGVIAQQIYARFKKGLTQDPRFGALIHVIIACGSNMSLALKLNRISNLHQR